MNWSIELKYRVQHQKQMSMGISCVFVGIQEGTALNYQGFLRFIACGVLSYDMSFPFPCPLKPPFAG